MSTVLEVYEWDYCRHSETLYIEAEVEDSILAAPQTFEDPEQWVPGRCWATIFWPDGDFEAPTSQSIAAHLAMSNLDWKLIEPD